MTSDLRHLMPKAATMVSRTSEERIEYACRKHWLGYPVARTTIDRMRQIMVYPRSMSDGNLLISSRPGIDDSPSILEETVNSPVAQS